MGQPAAAGRHGETAQLEGLGSAALLRGLAAQDRAAVLDAGRTRRGARGRVLLSSRDDAALIVLSGAAKEHQTLSEVEDVVLGLLAPGEVAGLSGVLGSPVAGAVTALLLDGDKLRSLARSRPAVARAWLQTVTEQLTTLRTQTLAFAASSVSERVVYRLVELAERFGVPADGTVRIDAPLSQAELASWARASRESAARALRELRDARIVATRRRTLTILDLEALRHRQPHPRPYATAAPAMIDLTVEAASDPASAW